MSERPCPKCNGTRVQKCWMCNGSAGESKTYGGETKWYACANPNCNRGVTPCDNCGGRGSVSS